MDKYLHDFLEGLSRVSVPLWVIGLSIWAATAHTIRRVKEGELGNFSFREWVGDMVISSFIGVLTYYLCKYAQIDDMLTGVAVGVSSHMGTKAIVIFEGAFMATFKKWRGK